MAKQQRILTEVPLYLVSGNTILFITRYTIRLCPIKRRPRYEKSSPSSHVVIEGFIFLLHSLLCNFSEERQSSKIIVKIVFCIHQSIYQYHTSVEFCFNCVSYINYSTTYFCYGFTSGYFATEE